MEALQNEFEEACRGGDLRQAAEILRIAKYHCIRIALLTWSIPHAVAVASGAPS